LKGGSTDGASLSIGAPFLGEPGGGLLCWGPRRIFRKGSGEGASLFIGAPLLGNLEEGSSTGDFESWMKGLSEWGIALSRGCMEGASGRAPLPGKTKDEWRAPGREHLCSVGGSLLGIQKDIGRRAQRMDMSVHQEL